MDWSKKCKHDMKRRSINWHLSEAFCKRNLNCTKSESDTWKPGWNNRTFLLSSKSQMHLHLDLNLKSSEKHTNPRLQKNKWWTTLSTKKSTSLKLSSRKSKMKPLPSNLVWLRSILSNSKLKIKSSTHSSKTSKSSANNVVNSRGSSNSG